VYEGTCFGHVMSEVCHYATNDDKTYVRITLVNVKVYEAKLQKTITSTKKSGKGKQEWEKACMDSGLRP